jgi:hypothetical protein
MYIVIKAQDILILNKLNKKFITLVSLYWYTMMHGQQNIKQATSARLCHSVANEKSCDNESMSLTNCAGK